MAQVRVGRVRLLIFAHFVAIRRPPPSNSKRWLTKVMDRTFYCVKSTLADLSPAEAWRRVIFLPRLLALDHVQTEAWGRLASDLPAPLQWDDDTSLPSSSPAAVMVADRRRFALRANLADRNHLAGSGYDRPDAGPEDHRAETPAQPGLQLRLQNEGRRVPRGRPWL